MKIRFCEHNEGSVKTYKRLLKEFPEENIKRKNCIKSCGPCHKSPFALVKGKAVRAVDGEELYHKLVAALKDS
jgi:uncharacterized protein YuzB (UPF0349 family)